MSGRHAPAMQRGWRPSSGDLRDHVLLIATIVAAAAALAMLFFGVLILLPR